MSVKFQQTVQDVRNELGDAVTRGGGPSGYLAVRHQVQAFRNLC